MQQRYVGRSNSLVIAALSPWRPARLREYQAQGRGGRGVQGAAEQECLRQPPSEVGRCQERIYRGDYPTYEKNRPGD